MTENTIFIMICGMLLKQFMRLSPYLELFHSFLMKLVDLQTFLFKGKITHFSKSKLFSNRGYIQHGTCYTVYITRFGTKGNRGYR